MFPKVAKSMKHSDIQDQILMLNVLRQFLEEHPESLQNPQSINIKIKNPRSINSDDSDDSETESDDEIYWI